jgi:hypothetical protein
MDEEVLRGRVVRACYERAVRPEDGEPFLLLAVEGSVKKRGWVREAAVGRLFPRVGRLAHLGAFDVKPAGQKPRLPMVGEEAAHVLVRLAFRRPTAPAVWPPALALPSPRQTPPEDSDAADLGTDVLGTAGTTAGRERDVLGTAGTTAGREREDMLQRTVVALLRRVEALEAHVSEVRMNAAYDEAATNDDAGLAVLLEAIECD